MESSRMTWVGFCDVTQAEIWKARSVLICLPRYIIASGTVITVKDTGWPAVFIDVCPVCWWSRNVCVLVWCYPLLHLDSHSTVLTLYAGIKSCSFILYLREFHTEISWNIEADVTALSQFALEWLCPKQKCPSSSKGFSDHIHGELYRISNSKTNWRGDKNTKQEQ